VYMGVEYIYHERLAALTKATPYLRGVGV